MIDLNLIQPICIAGEWRAGGGDLYESLYPATGEAVARLHAASLEDVEEAMAGAHRAFREAAGPSASLMSGPPCVIVSPR
ncbi:hypothetical protein P4123_15995 [Pseudomonas aeruginosa]|nr:hypothetical protein [Pseudomonas aeruginosa]